MSKPIAKELIELAGSQRMPPGVRAKLMELAARLQPGNQLEGLVKFADGSYGCHTCGERPDGSGRIPHVMEFHHA